MAQRLAVRTFERSGGAPDSFLADRTSDSICVDREVLISMGLAPPGPVHSTVDITAFFLLMAD